MPATASVRDLRNRFPRVRQLLETEGEVLLTERGRPRYRLIRHAEPSTPKVAPIDYWARLTAYHPTPLTPKQAESLREENRGER